MSPQGMEVKRRGQWLWSKTEDLIHCSKLPSFFSFLYNKIQSSFHWLNLRPHLLSCSLLLTVSPHISAIVAPTRCTHHHHVTAFTLTLPSVWKAPSHEGLFKLMPFWPAQALPSLRSLPSAPHPKWHHLICHCLLSLLHFHFPL